MPVPVYPKCPTFGGYPDILVLLKHIQETFQGDVRHWHLQWKSNPIDFRDNHRIIDNIRVPCDIRQYNVTMAQWHPWEITGTNISDGPGVLQTLL